MRNAVNKLKSRILRGLFVSIYKPGHFYSQLPSIAEIEERKEKIFDTSKREMGGIDLAEHAQLELLKSLKKYYAEVIYNSKSETTHRYFYENNFFINTDAIILHTVLRQFSPKKIIEIGSGFSSAVILDTNEFFFRNEMSCTFVEPHPERLLSLLKSKDSNSTIKKTFVQYIDPALFEELEANDILFIDSSHVSKIGSDVNFLFFEIFPLLKKGVIVHLHDIFYPFEYPKTSIDQGMFWNEAYLLRSFLMFNNTFKVLLFNSFLHKFYSEWFKLNMPACDSEGGSFWMIKQ